MQPTQSKKQCSIEGCCKPAKGRGWCAMHWGRWRTHGDPCYVKPKTAAPECTLPDCHEKRHAHGLCSGHLYRKQRYGDPYRDGPGAHTGRKRTENPGYDCVHRRLSRERGPARDHKCAECGRQAEEWAYMGGCPNEQVQITRGSALRFSADPNRYRPLCRKCHRPEDDSVTRNRTTAGTFDATAPAYIAPAPTMTPHHRRATKRRATPGETPGATITITERTEP